MAIIRATVNKENCKHLIPHHVFQKFVETDEVIPLGTELEGHKIEVRARFYGKNRIYNLFETTNKKLLYTEFLKFN